MDPNFNAALTDAVRRWARPTTPDELKRRGVARVRSLSLNRIASLIEKAVNRTMISRTLGGFPDDGERFSTDAREEFLRLVRDSSSPSSSSSGELEGEAVSALERLKLELSERKREVEEERRSLTAVGGAVGEADELLERKLRELFAAWGGSPDDPSPLEREVIRLAVAELRSERGRAQLARLEEHQRQVDIMERRISKLTQLLGETEAELQRAMRQGGVDGGIASIFEDVQGIAAGDAQYEKKAALMSAIFEANLELQTSLGVLTGT